MVKQFEKDHPGVKVEVRESQDDEKMRQAISTGKGPDLGISSSTDIVGLFPQPGART